jgi:hypothetical protein
MLSCSAANLCAQVQLLLSEDCNKRLLGSLHVVSEGGRPAVQPLEPVSDGEKLLSPKVKHCATAVSGLWPQLAGLCAIHASFFVA